MPKEEWGTKRLCPHCATRFYDLQNDPMTCPACGAQFTVDSLVQGRGKAIVSERSSRANAGDDDQVDVLDDDAELDDDSGDLDDDLLEEDDDEGDVSLDDIADVSADEDE